MRHELYARGVISLLLIAALFVTPASAVEPSSSNYRFDEASIGVSSMLESNSANYKATSGAGDTAVGATGSANFQAEAGSDTTHAPNLTMAVTGATANFGSFSPSVPATATATFSVVNYTSYGYVVQLTGTPPRYGTHEIDAMATTGTSQPGIEQFGVNLVANTSPTSFGSNPQNGTTPNNFGFGEATPNYGTTNQYRYVSGESVAQAPKSSGKTDYTISYLINVGPLTPGGAYASFQTVIVTGTY